MKDNTFVNFDCYNWNKMINSFPPQGNGIKNISAPKVSGLIGDNFYIPAPQVNGIFYTDRI